MLTCLFINLSIFISIYISISILYIYLSIDVHICIPSPRPPTPPTPRLTQFDMPEEGETESCRLTLSRDGSPFVNGGPGAGGICHGCTGCQGTCHQVMYMHGCHGCHVNCHLVKNMTVLSILVHEIRITDLFPHLESMPMIIVFKIYLSIYLYILFHFESNYIPCHP